MLTNHVRPATVQCSQAGEDVAPGPAGSFVLQGKLRLEQRTEKKFPGESTFPPIRCRYTCEEMQPRSRSKTKTEHGAA